MLKSGMYRPQKGGQVRGRLTLRAVSRVFEMLEATKQHPWSVERARAVMMAVGSC